MKSIIKYTLLISILLIEQLSGSTQNNRLELPKYNKLDQIVNHTYYTLSYNEKHEQANWVAYQLNFRQINGTTTRKKNERWKQDPKIITGSSKLSDYKKSGYDRGHLVPAADMKLNTTSMRETFYMSNISPQHKDCNRFIWKELEKNIRDFIKNKNDVLYIVTGPLLNNDLKSFIGNNVTIPEYFFKVLLDYSPTSAKAIGFIIPNHKTDKKFTEFAVSIDYIEKITKIDFFYNLSDSIENKIESNFNINNWHFSK